MHFEIKNILFFQLTLHLSDNFRQKYKEKKNTSSAETAWKFLASKVLVLRRNKPASSRTLAIQFSTAMKTLSHQKIFKISDFPIACSRAVCHLGIIVIIYIWKSICYQIYGTICPCFDRGLLSLFRWLYQSLTKPFFAPINPITRNTCIAEPREARGGGKLIRGGRTGEKWSKSCNWGGWI